jgi:pyrroloquinoline quinone biosynthesis protein B
MKVRVLGTAAGGGWPQWNCACVRCEQARHRSTGRTQDCVAVSGDGRAWYLLNASPDLRGQLLAAPELAPGPGRRDTPLRGVLLSTAELDHTIGLLTLREADRMTVYGSPAVLRALRAAFPIQRVLSRYTKLDWQVTRDAPVMLDGGLEAHAIAIGSKWPRYAEPARGEDWAVAYRLHDPSTGGVLVYAPCLPTWTPAMAAAVDGADCLLLDGTFLHDDEMVRATGHGASARTMGHLPITHSLPLLPPRPGRRYLYTHLNNTNPLTMPGAPELALLGSAGAGVATDGLTFTL